MAPGAVERGERLILRARISWVRRACALRAQHFIRAAGDPEQNLPYWAEIWPSGIALADDGTPPPAAPLVSTRIGLSAGQEHPWRWCSPGSPHLSRPG